MNVDVAVVGTPFLDLTFERMPRLPGIGEELLGRALHVGPGGAGMQAVALARLGISVALVGPLGSDFGGAFLRDLLRREGVEVVGEPQPGATSTTALLSTPGGVAMATVLGDGEPSAEQVRAAGARAVLASLGRLHLAPEDTAVYAVTGQLEIHQFDRSTLDRLPGARAVVATAAEAAALTGIGDAERAALQLAAIGTVGVVTLGADGAMGAENAQVIRAAAPRVDAVDATGAGDLFAAAYVWADLRGASLPDRLAWACLYAGLSVREPTALAGALRLEELLREGTKRGLTAP